jgi:8-oxo-dGTP diphosphatase
MKSKGPLLVVAGVIQQNGRVLIAQRKEDDSFPLKWEFPGGKIEPGETPKQALRRELNEELGIEAEIGPEIARYEYNYPRQRHVVLLFFDVRRFRNEPRNLAFTKFLWEERQKLPDYDFLDGDVDFVRRLASGKYLKKRA